MKSLWDKASEYGSKAKEYLKKGEEQTKKEEELEKAYAEKYNGLKKEIENFQNDSIKNYEEKIKSLNSSVTLFKEENENLQNLLKNKSEVEIEIKSLKEILLEKDKQLIDKEEKIQKFEKEMSGYKIEIESLRKLNEIPKLEIVQQDPLYNDNLIQESDTFIIEMLIKIKEYFLKFEESSKYDFNKKTFEIKEHPEKLDEVATSSTNTDLNLNNNVEENINIHNTTNTLNEQQATNQNAESSKKKKRRNNKKSVKYEPDEINVKDETKEDQENKSIEQKEEFKEHSISKIEEVPEFSNNSTNYIDQNLSKIETTVEKKLDLNIEIENLKNDLIIIFKKSDFFSNLQNNLNNLKLNEESYKSYKNQLEIINTTLKIQLVNLTSDLNEKETLNKTLEKDKESLTVQINQKNQEIKSLDEKVPEYQKEIKTYKEDINSLSLEITYLKNSNINHETEKLNLKSQIDNLQSELTNNLEKCKNENELESLNLKENIETLNVKLINYESENKKSQDTMNNLKQTFKQFFLMLLDEDIFIDLIEKTFKITDTNLLFESLYKLTKLIKPKFTINLYSSVMKDSTIWGRLSKYNLDIETLYEYTEIKSLSQLENLSSQEENENSNHFHRILICNLCNYIDSLNSSITKQTKTNQDLSSQLKSVKETLEESKKNDGEKYDLLNKHITKLQQDCRENLKIEKTLKETIETLESANKEIKFEQEKMKEKNKSMNILHEELNKEKSILNDKILSLNQQLDLFKVENSELIDKSSESEQKIRKLQDSIKELKKENESQISLLREMDKIRNSLHEKIETINKKDQEINKLINAYKDLEEFIESLKIEKENVSEMYKKQIFDMAAELETIKESNRIYEDKFQNESQFDKKKYEEMEKLVTDMEIENKHLKEQKEKMKKYSEEILIKVKNDLKDTEFMIDKRMISNILIKYFEQGLNSSIKISLLDTLANFMGFNNDERRKIGLSASNNQKMITSQSGANDKLKNLSDELYDFILNA
jgi:chromosome segregation ATPase